MGSQQTVTSQEWGLVRAVDGSAIASAQFSVAVKKKGKSKITEKKETKQNLVVYKSIGWLHFTSFIWHLWPPIHKMGFQELENTQKWVGAKVKGWSNSHMRNNED